MAKPNHPHPPPPHREAHRDPRLRGAIRLFIGVAMAISGYLAWASLSGGGVAGCGPESGCDAVLKSRWAYWLGIPVSLPALLVYAAFLVATFRLTPKAGVATQRQAWRAVIVLAAMILGAALWFVALQLLVIHRVCPFCMTAHSCGLVAAVLALIGAPIRQPSEIEWRREKQIFVLPRAVPALVAMALGGVGVLAAGQFVFQPRTYQTKNLGSGAALLASTGAPALQLSAPPPVPTNAGATPGQPTPTAPQTAALASTPASTVPPVPAVPPAQTKGQGAARVLSLYDGLFQFNLREVPVMGSPDAPNVIVSLFDYSCHHCQLTHGLLVQALRTFSNQLAIVSLPMPLSSNCNLVVKYNHPMHVNACDYAQLGLAVWRADRAKHEQFDHWLFSTARPPPVEVARQTAAQLIGAPNLERAQADRWIAAQIERDVSLYRTNSMKLGNGSMPQLMIGSQVTFGSLNGLQDLYRLLEKSFGLKAPGVVTQPTLTR